MQNYNNTDDLLEKIVDDFEKIAIAFQFLGDSLCNTADILTKVYNLKLKEYENQSHIQKAEIEMLTQKIQENKEKIQELLN